MVVPGASLPGRWSRSDPVGSCPSRRQSGSARQVQQTGRVFRGVIGRRASQKQQSRRAIPFRYFRSMVAGAERAISRVDVQGRGWRAAGVCLRDCVHARAGPLVLGFPLPVPSFLSVFCNRSRTRIREIFASILRSSPCLRTQSSSLACGPHPKTRWKIQKLLGRVFLSILHPV